MNSTMRTYMLIAPLLLASPASAETVLKPTGKWVINYDAAQCVAMRAFGTDSSPLHLLIKPSPTSDVVQLALIRNGRSSYGVQRKSSIKFGAFPAADIKALEYGTREGKNVTSANLPQSLVAQLSQSQTILWWIDGNHSGLEVGSMADVMKVMANCRDDLRTYWNIEPAKAKLLWSSARPEQPLKRYFRDEDYPDEALIGEDAGTTSVALLVDEKGILQDCMVDDTSSVPVLDAMTCIVLRQRGKFVAAVGSEGKPVKGAVTQRVRWELAE